MGELTKAYERLHESYRFYARYNGIDVMRVIVAMKDMDNASRDILYIQQFGEDNYIENYNSRK